MYPCEHIFKTLTPAPGIFEYAFCIIFTNLQCQHIVQKIIIILMEINVNISYMHLAMFD